MKQVINLTTREVYDLQVLLRTEEASNYAIRLSPTSIGTKIEVLITDVLGNTSVHDISDYDTW
jgi:hypothetical protein